jgi:hypothetical protein
MAPGDIYYLQGVAAAAPIQGQCYCAKEKIGIRLKGSHFTRLRTLVELEF